MIVTPNFHMNGNCKEAIKLYEKALQAEVVSVYCYSDAHPEDYQASQDEADLVYHAEIKIGQQRILMTDDIHSSLPKGNMISLIITFDSSDEVKEAFKILSDDCQLISPLQTTTYSSCFVSFIDKYGVRWELMTEYAS